MAHLIKPGTYFYAEPIELNLSPSTSGLLTRTMSTYGQPNLEGVPQKNVLYKMCTDFSIERVNDDIPVGWEVIEYPEKNYIGYRISQYGFEPRPMNVYFHSQDVQVNESCMGGLSAIFKMLNKK